MSLLGKRPLRIHERVFFSNSLGFFNTKFSQALAGREAHKLQLEQANAELTHALAGREAYKLQLEQANAELTQAIAGREAYRLQLEQPTPS